jgi:dTDP-4-amino-4,6-dideoxygalactose transaminase
MTLGLAALQRAADDPRRTEVIVPGYTCYSVAASVERAGLIPRLCDVDPSTLNPDLESLAGLDFSRVLAVVSANLYGLPNALQDLETLARKHGVFMLDDAAQSLGARYMDRPAGSFGDIGLFSFDKGKIITTLQGGVLVADPGRVADALDSALTGLQPASVVGTLATLLKLPVYALMLRPRLYGAVRQLPLGLGLTQYETDYPMESYSAALSGLATVQLERLAGLNATRRRNADRLRTSLAGVSGLVQPSVLPGAEPVFPRYPVFVEPQVRAGFIAALEQAGIGATASYPQALIDVPQVARRLPGDQRPTPGAREVANRIVTLPTHGYSPPDLAPRIAAIANLCCAPR